MRVYSSSVRRKSSAGAMPSTCCGASTSNDCCGDRRVMQGPRDRDYAGAYVVIVSDLSQYFDQSQVAAQSRLVEFDSAATPVILRERGDSLGGHLASEQAGDHGRIVDDSDFVGLRKGKDLLFDRATKHGVRRLKTGDRRDLLCALHLLHR